MVTWIVNDFLTTIPGSRTLWHDLVDWSAGNFVGGDFSHLASIVETMYDAAPDKPSLIIRNASYFRRIDVPVKTISLVQDIVPGGWQADVMDHSSLVVYNSQYTKAEAPTLASSTIIPLPVDFALFDVQPAAVDYDVIWVGAQSHVKGWDILLDVMARTSELRYCLVLKDAAPDFVPANAEVFIRRPQSELARLMNKSRAGLCTSRRETQHLAGLEMGACGLPLVATRVGAYYDRAMGVWGRTSETSAEALADAVREEVSLRRELCDVRAYWMSQGFTLDDCRRSWVEVMS